MILFNSTLVDTPFTPHYEQDSSCEARANPVSNHMEPLMHPSLCSCK
jgi:hypothetical protein